MADRLRKSFSYSLALSVRADKLKDGTATREEYPEGTMFRDKANGDILKMVVDDLTGTPLMEVVLSGDNDEGRLEFTDLSHLEEVAYGCGA